MLAGIVISLAVLVTGTLILLGFAANTARFEDRMRSPGCYWTWGVAFSLLMGVVMGASDWALMVGAGLMLVTACMWLNDGNRSQEATK